MRCAFLKRLSCAVHTLCVKEEDCFSQNGFSYGTEIKRGKLKRSSFLGGLGGGGRYVALGAAEGRLDTFHARLSYASLSFSCFLPLLTFSS